MNLDVDREESFVKALERLTYDQVQEKVTAKTLMTYSNNPLLLAVKVSSFIIIIFLSNMSVSSRLTFWTSISIFDA